MRPEVIIAAGLGIVVIVASIKWHAGRAHRFLKNWAEENGYKIVSADVRWFRRGPYSLFFTQKQIVLQFTVSDGNGDLKTGWACCGHGGLGLIREMVDVTWDEDQPSHAQAVSTPPAIRRAKPAHPNNFSLKKPTRWLWRTNVTREQVLKRLEDLEIREDWLICPLGEADRAITVGEFVSDPDAFAK